MAGDNVAVQGAKWFVEFITEFSFPENVIFHG
jgi:hypothetical protein